MLDLNPVITTAKAAVDPKRVDAVVDGVNVALLVTQSPSGGSQVITDLRTYSDKLLGAPRRKTGNVAFTSLPDLIKFAALHKPVLTAGQAGSSQLTAAGVLPAATPGSPTNFIDARIGTVTCILNYHDGATNGQQHCDFRAVYKPEFSNEWNAWTEECIGDQGGYMQVQQFAEFIEEHITDVVDFDAADKSDGAKAIRELAKLHGLTIADRAEVLVQSKGMRLTVKERVGQVVDLTSGQLSVEYETTHTGGDGKGNAAPKFQGMFVIGIPVFENGDVFRLPVRLKYRVEGGRLLFALSIINAEKAKETAIAEIRKKVADETGFATFYGSP